MAKKRKVDITDAENRAIQSGIELDPDSPEWTTKDFEQARPASEVLPQIVEAYKQGKLKRRGRGPQKSPKKEPVSIRLDQDIVKYYRKKGKGWQAQLNEDLRKVVGLENNH